MNDLTDEERARILRVVDENKGGVYWNILEVFIKEWLKEENEYLASFRNGIKPDQVDAYNKAIERREMCERFLLINEEIIELNLTVIQRAKKLARVLVDSMSPFVKNKDLSENGQK